MAEPNRFGWALRNADAATLAKRFVYLRYVLVINMRNPIWAVSYTHETGGAQTRFDLGDYASNRYIL